MPEENGEKPEWKGGEVLFCGGTDWALVSYRLHGMC